MPDINLTIDLSGNERVQRDLKQNKDLDDRFGRAGGRPFGVRMRRRYVRYFDLGETEAVGLVGELDARNLWSGLTFFRGDDPDNLRQGLRVFRSPQG